MILKRIFSLRVANVLLKEGFELVGYEINTSNPKLKVFLFESTDKLNSVIDRVIGKKD